MKVPEWKVAIPGAAGVTVTAIFQILQTYVHGFHAPSGATMAAIMTVATVVTGYLSPHTSRSGRSTSLSADPTVSEFAQWARARGYQARIETEPAATTTGPVSPYNAEDLAAAGSQGVNIS